MRSIAHVGPAIDPPVLSTLGGAIQRRIIELARVQAAAGHRVAVYSIGPRTEVREVDGVTVQFIRCRTPLPLRHVEFQHRALRRLRGTTDVVHFHSQPEGGVLTGRRPASLLSYDHYYFRGGRGTPLYAPYRRFLRRFDVLLPCSEYCRDMSADYWGLGADELEVLYNGVNTTQFRPDPEAAAAERALLGVSGPVFMYLGRLTEQKGTDVLLEAALQLRATHPAARLVVAGPIGQFGGEADPQDWRGRIAAVNGVYLGAVEDARLRGLLSMADVFVMPTRDLEMFGMAVVEAQACGAAVVASDHGGLRETVPLDVGARVAVGDADGFAREIGALLDDPQRRAACSRAALRSAARYEWSLIAERTEQLYELALAKVRA
jgi:glycosyltransferase involved in cell wall biosynthesis